MNKILKLHYRRCVLFQMFILIGMSYSILSNNSDTTYRWLFKKHIVVGTIYQYPWKINALNDKLNLPRIANYIPIVKYNMLLMYKRYIANFQMTLGSNITKKNMFNFGCFTIGLGHRVFKLGDDVAHLLFHYSYSGYRYTINYLPNHTLININSSNLNGGSLILDNSSSLVGVSFVLTNISKTLKIKEVIELFYLQGIGSNQWKSRYYNLVYTPLHENFSIIGLSVGF